MSNIAISELTNTVSTLNDGDLLLVSKVGNNIYTSSKMTYATLVNNLKNTVLNKGKYLDGTCFPLVSANGSGIKALQDVTINKTPKIVYTTENDCMLYIQDDGTTTEYDEPGVRYSFDAQGNFAMGVTTKDIYKRSLMVPVKAGTNIYASLNNGGQDPDIDIVVGMIFIEYKMV